MSENELTHENFNKYVGMAEVEYADWVYTESRTSSLKGHWRAKAFQSNEDISLDLEIGVGNGYFFEHLCKSHPDRKILGIELKYKPLIQTLKRALKSGSQNMRLIRCDATEIDEVFAQSELNNVYIFFPDPWPKKRHHKNRLITFEFLRTLYDLQKPGSTLEIKTDNQEYFEWILERVKKSPYLTEAQTDNLHESAWASSNFLTHFEKLWTGKGLRTHYLRLRKTTGN